MIGTPTDKTGVKTHRIAADNEFSQGLVCSAPTGRHCVKVPEAAEERSQPQGFPPRMRKNLDLIG